MSSASSFQENLQELYNGNFRYAEPTTKRVNMYTNQREVTNGVSPKDPTADSNFYTNYRNTTRDLGKVAKSKKTTGQELPNVDSETRAIMNRIKLPTYNDILPDYMGQIYMGMYKRNPQQTEKDFNEASNEFEKENFYYKLRAAQILKNKPESVREGYLNNFNISAYDAKNELDKLITSENEKYYSMTNALKKLTEKGINYFNNSVNEAFRSLTGAKKADENDENGLDELAERLGENDSFRLYSASDYKNGELTDEAKARGPSSWNSKTTNPDGTPKNSNDTDETKEESESEDVVTYTYQPGDTFGQVIRKLGLGTDKGLWGPDGDVAYYNQQLLAQGIWPDNQLHNIPIGTTIKLKRRK